MFIALLEEPGEVEISVHLSQIRPLRFMEVEHLPQILHLVRAELGLVAICLSQNHGRVFK